MSINFTNSQGETINITHTELNIISTNLEANNMYFVYRDNYLVYVRVTSGMLLLMDLYPNINRRLFETYTVGYNVLNPFFLKFTHNITAIESNIDDAFISVGYSGTTPITTLEEVFITSYNTFDNRYILTNDLVKKQWRIWKNTRRVESNCSRGRHSNNK